MEELLEKLGIDWRLLIAQIVNFAILFVILRKFLYRPVLAMLAERGERIAKGLADAEQSSERLRGVELERKDVLHRAEMERQGMLERASADVDALRHTRIAAAEAEAAHVLERARVEAQRERADLLADVRREVGDLLAAVSQRVTASELPAAVHERLIATASEELQRMDLGKRRS